GWLAGMGPLACCQPGWPAAGGRGIGPDGPAGPDGATPRGGPATAEGPEGGEPAAGAAAAG
ncbi:hypothetical protein OSH47_25235, partial [Mycobacterium ulcerans]